MKPIFTQGPSVTFRVIFAVVFSLALMIMDHRQNHLEAVRSTLATLLSPLLYVVNLPRTVGEWADETLTTRESLQRSNETLRRENLLLKAEQQKMAALESENTRLRNLLDSSFRIGERVLIAELMAIELDPYRQQVMINKGTNSGVFQGQPVLDAGGVMGQVVHVHRSSSSVLMITDISHALPVQINRNGLRTIAMGTGRINSLDLPNLPNNADIREGDLLVTSGLGGRFPAGYPVARITTVIHKPGEPFADVEAQPVAHLDRTREALLVWTLEPYDELPAAADMKEKSDGETTK
ncbi:MAG: rod shape-determining protein MreC [Candidatus Sedimenticola sp. (ex Thyasira tokunagai)]